MPVLPADLGYYEKAVVGGYCLDIKIERWKKGNALAMLGYSERGACVVR